MISQEQKAHEIALAILPDVVKEDELHYFEKHSNRGESFNATEVIDLYYTVYEGLLKGLQEYDGVEQFSHFHLFL